MKCKQAKYDNLAIVISYHNEANINFTAIKEHVLDAELTDYIFWINNDTHPLSIIDGFDFRYPGIQFDELCAQWYFYQFLSSKFEYVYHTHYRRFLSGLEHVVLRPDTAYIVYYSGSSCLLRERLYHQDTSGFLTKREDSMFYPDQQPGLKKVFKYVYNISDEDYECILDMGFQNFEMYIMSTEMQGDMIRHVIECLKIILEESKFCGVHRHYSWLTEYLVSFWFNYKIFKENLNIVNMPVINLRE